MSDHDYKADLEISGDVARFDLWYPRSNTVKAIEVGLMDVMAADSIRIEYDFERDGWSIRQASVFEWDADDDVCDSDWQEVAFVAAWKRQEEAWRCTVNRPGDGRGRCGVCEGCKQ